MEVREGSVTAGGGQTEKVGQALYMGRHILQHEYTSTDTPAHYANNYRSGV